MADSGSDFSQVKSSYDDVNTALENLLGNVGTSSNFVTQSQLTAALSSITGTNPVGTILPYGTNTIPNGYLLCNGASYDTGKYAQLYSAIGSGSVPDMRGMFLRGLDTSGTVDNYGATRNLLSFEEGSAIAFDGNWTAVCISGQNPGVPSTYANMMGPQAKLGMDSAANRSEVVSVAWSGAISGNAGDGSTEMYYGIARPKNIAVNYIIKAVA